MKGVNYSLAIYAVALTYPLYPIVTANDSSRKGRVFATPLFHRCLTAGKTYYFDIILYTTSGSSGGIQVDLNGGTPRSEDFQTLCDASSARTELNCINVRLCK